MRPLSLIAALAVCLGIAACGEKDESEPAAPTTVAGTTSTAKPDTGGGGGGGDGAELSPEKQIEEAVQTVLGGGKPAVSDACSNLVTARYVKQAYGDESGCRAAVAGQKPFDVAVGQIEIMGNFASARAEPDAGPNEGETIKVELVLEGDTYRVDSAVSNAPAGP